MGYKKHVFLSTCQIYLFLRESNKFIEINNLIDESLKIDRMDASQIERLSSLKIKMIWRNNNPEAFQENIQNILDTKTKIGLLEFYQYARLITKHKIDFLVEATFFYEHIIRFKLINIFVYLLFFYV